jgi:uncharacterized protein YceH (UPF0502 family)
MNVHLTALEARVVGSLIEKAITTPDQYPLSLNALTNACNQKSNRDPVLELDERTVQETLDGLAKKHLVLERSGFGGRVPKYQHRFCNTGFGSLEFTPQETAILCELLLRGPQTPGELRGRASRMAPISEVSEVETALSRLASREDGPFVVRLAREPAKRESRYAHLFSGSVEGAAEGIEQHLAPEVPAVPTQRADAPGSIVSAMQDRIAQLEQRVAQLERQIEGLRKVNSL